MLQPQNAEFQHAGQLSSGRMHEDGVPPAPDAVRSARLETRVGQTESVACGPAIPADAVKMVEAALDRLPPRDRLVIRLRHFDQLSFDRIASGLGISTPTAEKLWARAVRNLWRALEEAEAFATAKPARD